MEVCVWGEDTKCGVDAWEVIVIGTHGGQGEKKCVTDRHSERAGHTDGGMDTVCRRQQTALLNNAHVSLLLSPLTLLGQLLIEVLHIDGLVRRY